MLKQLQSMLSESSGAISTTRVIAFLVVLTILGIYIAQNISAMSKCGGYVDFPTNTVMVLLIVLGTKVGQHFSETINEKNMDKSNDGENVEK